MREQEKKLINGHEWTVTPWPAMYGLKIQARLAPLVSKSLGETQKGDLLDSDAGKIAAKLLESISEHDTPKLIRDILHGVRVEGKDVTLDRNFDDLFCANYGELFKGLWFVLQTNFQDLFTMAGDFGSQTAQEKVKKS